MADTPPRPRKVSARARRPRPAKRHWSPWSVIPSVVVAGLFAAAGYAGWWMIQPSSTPTEVAETPTEVSLDPAVPTPTAASPAAVTAGPVVAPQETPQAGPVPAPVAPATEPDASKVPVDFSRLLVLDSMGSAKPENLAWFDDSWRIARTSGRWDAYRALLSRSLQAVVRVPVDLENMLDGKSANMALLRHAFLTAVPEQDLAPLWADGEQREFIQWLLESPAAMQSFTAQLSRRDDAGKALAVWAALAAEHPGARTDYQELAIACALVFDRTIKAEHGGSEAIDPVQRYTHFRQNDEAGKLTGRIKKMTAADLIWVVGVPVTQQELDWAIRKADFRQKTWGAAYSRIKYDMEKAVKGTDVYDGYTFAEILKKGGICSDQSYFAAWTACAHGIPAAILGGDGPRGPHAWITWMADEGSWKSSGRIPGYPAGSGRDPQTGESISEEEFLRFNDPKNGSPGQGLKARRLLWMAQVYEAKPELALPFLTEAVKTLPRLAAPSAALLEHWTKHRAEAAVTEWVAMLRDLRKHFRDSAALMEAAQEAEEKFVFSRQDVAATMKDLRREGRKLNDTSSADAGVAADPKRLTEGLKRQAGVMQKNNDPAAIRSLYKKALADYGNNPATFKALAEDFFEFSKEDPALAAKACQELESACRRNVGRGKGEFFDVLGQNSAWLVVADCYYAAGDPDKAAQIRRDCESRIQMAKKQAL